MSCLDATRDILKSEICPQKAILEEFRFLLTDEKRRQIYHKIV